ncbi:hypothetical protein F3Y22_tig00110860pilonHSYRG00042 [Hibiscus syriacus]|uniref:CCHC-type domain-containing protein n=1 Tax=Hibiscus syriacus TaxID=106335 RepID=A0A6A2ZLQ2_HIBSY|nr:hypothetical protein F3Y22_tig00110860pilonHSYRG00042 [Hibiscus syriacus]
MKFTGNKIAYFDLCDYDTISLLDFCEMMEQILVLTPLQLFWLLPNAKLTESSIMSLGIDSGVMKMVQSLPRNIYIHIYAQVKGITESGCYESGGVEVDNAESGDVEMDNAESGVAEMDTAKMGSVERDNAEMGSVERDNAESGGVEMDSAESDGVEMDNAKMGSVKRDNVEMGSVERDNAKMDKSSNEGVRGTKADFEEVVVEEENNGSNESDSDFQETDGENSFDDEESLPSMVEEDVINILGDMGRHEFNNRSDEMFDSSPVNSRELYSDRDSDSDARSIFHEFNKETDMEKPKFQKGMMFCSKETLKEAIRQYGMVNRTTVLFKVNDNKRLQIKTYESEHTCAKLLKNKNVSYRFIGMKYIQKFMSDMNYSLTSLKQDVMTDYGTVCYLTKCGRAREHALEMIQAVGTDANGRIYPIAYAVVESENQYSWLWFLEILGRDLDIDNSYGWCFMSDRQKVLVEAVAELFPNAEARNCVRHIYANLKKDHKGKALKDALWRAARATYGREFQDVITELKTLSNDAFEWLKHLNPQQWSKAHFSTTTKSDMLLNNLCECFNKIILEARDKPILTMMELIRTKIIRRIVCRYEAAENINGSLCPNIQKKLNIVIDQATRCWATHAGGLKYQVECGPGNQHVVDMGSHSCSCRKWDLTGIPSYTASRIEKTAWKANQKKRKEADERNKNGPKLSKKGLMGNCSKCGKPGHNKRTCRGEVGGNRSLNQHESGSNQPHAPDQPSQHSTPMQRQARTIQPTRQQVLRPKLPTMRPLNPPTTVRWMIAPSITDHAMPGSQESFVSNPHNQDLHTTSKE